MHRRGRPQGVIIIKGRARADGEQLASYLLEKGDNELVRVVETRGMVGRDLQGAFLAAEIEAGLSRGSRPFWHAQINPAEGVNLTREQQLMAVDVLERHLGFQGLSRAVVAHEKDGREHVHVVWSRFDRERGTLRRDDFTKRKNVAAAAEIARRLGLEPNPNPFPEDSAEDIARGDRRHRSKDAHSQAEMQQEKRATKSRADRKAEITSIWQATDSGQALRSALDDAGYSLGVGWRGYVVVDALGEAHSLARQIDGARAKDVRARMADVDQGSIPSASEIKAGMRQARQDCTRDRDHASAEQTGPDHSPEAAQASRKGGQGREVPPPPENTQRPSRASRRPAGNPETETAGIAKADDEALPKTAADILAALTRNHSTFTRQDLARLIDRETGGGGGEPWMMKAGGLDELDDDSRASAERSYAKWADENAELADRISLTRYVAYVQGKQAERDAADPAALDARRNSKAEFDALMAGVEGSADLIRLGPDRAGRERFTSREMLETELRMQGSADSLAGRTDHATREKIRIAAPSLDGLGEGQRAAFDHITAAGDLALVVGYAGTGKSRMLGAAREAWEAEGYRVRGAALSGIAAESLQQDAGIKSRTLHSLIHQLDTIESQEAGLASIEGQLASITGTSRKASRYRADLDAKREDMAACLDATRLTDRDIVVIDEAAMIGSRQMERLLAKADEAGAKVVLVGDAEQLQAIDAGAAFRALRDRHGAAEITEIRRQREDWQKDATRAFANADTAEALDRYRAAGMTHQAGTRDQAKANLVEAWTKVRQAQPEATQIVLAYTRADVAELNQLARAAYRNENRLGEDHSLVTADGKKEFAAGDRLYFTKNDLKLSVKNGSLGTIDRIEGDRVSVTLDGGQGVSFEVGDYGYITHGYAATVHKSQGVTVDRAHVLASRYMDRHAVYVGMSRHREGADLYYGVDEFKDWNSVTRRMARDGSKDSTLDYVARAPETGPSESLRAAADEFWQREKKDAPRPAWLDMPAKTAPTSAGVETVRPEAVTRTPGFAVEATSQPADSKASIPVQTALPDDPAAKAKEQQDRAKEIARELLRKWQAAPGLSRGPSR